MLETSMRTVVQERHAAPPPKMDFRATETSQPETAARPARGAALLRATIGIPLLALGVLLISLGLMPGVFVALIAFLPALAPLLLVGFGILATAEIPTPDDRLCDPNQPCCCGRH
jgi:hypothetical protein